MNNVFVYLEIEGTAVADVSLELLTKGRKLANQLGCQLEAIAAGAGLEGIEKQVLPYGVDKLHVFDAPGLFPYTSLPHASILINLFKEEKPQICLMGATVIGRDLGPRVSSALTSGLTADCTALEIGSHEDKKAGNCALQVVIYPESAHRVVGGGIYAHRGFIGVFPCYAFVHFKEVAVLFFDSLEPVAFYSVGKVQIYSAALAVYSGAYASPVVARLFCCP